MINKKNISLLIREMIINSNPNYRNHDIGTEDNRNYRYLHDKRLDLDFIWYKKLTDRSSYAINPDCEDFKKFLSKCDDDELKELVVRILSDTVSCVTRSDLINFIYNQYKENLEYA